MQTSGNIFGCHSQGHCCQPLHEGQLRCPTSYSLSDSPLPQRCIKAEMSLVQRSQRQRNAKVGMALLQTCGSALWATGKNLVRSKDTAVCLDGKGQKQGYSKTYYSGQSLRLYKKTFYFHTRNPPKQQQTNNAVFPQSIKVPSPRHLGEDSVTQQKENEPMTHARIISKLQEG